MKYFKLFVFVLTFYGVSVFSQEKNIKHYVVKGETISSIAEKYNVSTTSIYQLNPKAKKNLQLNQVILVPNSDVKKTNKGTAVAEKSKDINHEVLPKETLYGIVKQYKTTTALLYKANPKLETEGLKIGQTICIPTLGLTKKEIAILSNKNTEEIVEVVPLTYQVKPKETLYSIARQYSVSIKELKEVNPKIGTKGLTVGQLIVIPSNGKLLVEPVIVEKNVIQEETGLSVVSEKDSILSNEKRNELAQKELPISKDIETIAPKEIVPLEHKVKSGESLYAIAKQYAITFTELKGANPKISGKGLSVGQLILIPSNGKLVVDSAVVGNDGANMPNKEGVVSEKIISNPVVEANVIEQKEISAGIQNGGTDVIHEVLPKETKYGIAKKYGITVAVLEEQNPAIQQKLLVGSKLTVRIPNATIGVASKEEVVDAKIEETNSNITIGNEDIVNQLIASASGYLGTRYRMGGTTTAGFDCSGLMCSTFGSLDIKLPRSSIEQSSFGEKIESENVKKGDLIFFKTNGRSRINHVGMVVEVAEGEIKFIHSSTSSGVIVSSTKEPYYRRNFVQVNRVLK